VNKIPLVIRNDSPLLRYPGKLVEDSLPILLLMEMMEKSHRQHNVEYLILERKPYSAIGHNP
jgi:hypothetical protein